MSSAVTEALYILTGVITRSRATPESRVSSSGRRPSAPPRAPITLDDAVSVNRSLEKSNLEQEKPTFTRDEINAMVQRAILAGLKDIKGESSVPALISPAESNRKESREPTLNLKKRPSQKFCFDCGQKDHVRGDSSCKSPRFYTKMLPKEAKYKDSADKGNNGNGMNCFQRGS